MGIIKEIINKIRVFISDLKRNFGLLVIIITIWIVFLVGILFLYVYIGETFAPRDSFINFMVRHGFNSNFVIGLFTQVVQGFIGAMYVLFWLLLWQRLVRMYFWRTIKKSEPSTKQKDVAEE